MKFIMSAIYELGDDERDIYSMMDRFTEAVSPDQRWLTSYFSYGPAADAVLSALDHNDEPTTA